MSFLLNLRRGLKFISGSRSRPNILQIICDVFSLIKEYPVVLVLRRVTNFINTFYNDILISINRGFWVKRLIYILNNEINNSPLNASLLGATRFPPRSRSRRILLQALQSVYIYTSSSYLPYLPQDSYYEYIQACYSYSSQDSPQAWRSKYLVRAQVRKCQLSQYQKSCPSLKRISLRQTRQQSRVSYSFLKRTQR